MGKGDKKSKKGKIWRGSFGNSRLKKKIRERLKRLASVPKASAGVEAGDDKPKRRVVVKKKEEQS